MERFAAVGLNHKYAPLEVRECLAFADATLPLALKTLREKHGIDQAVIVSTCNRVEIIVFSPLPDVTARIRAFLADFHHLSEDFFADSLYSHTGRAAIEHVFRVASSLDSLVLGETQILAQLKQAYSISAAEGATGKALNSLLHRAFSVAKDLHTHTTIAKGQLSIASVAVSFIRRTFDSLERKTALLIGMGETGRLTLTHLREAGIGNVIIVNRTLERARELARQCGGDAVPLDLLPDYLGRADIVVSQTSAPHVIVRREHITRAMRERNHRAMFLIDLAVPRDIAPEIDDIDGVFRYEVDDLQRVVAQATDARARELERCNELIAQHLQEFCAGFATTSVEPVITAMRARADAIAEAELARIRDPRAREEAQRVVERVVNKLLHGQVAALKDETRRSGMDPRTIELLSRMFGAESAPANDAAPVVQPEASDAR